MNNLFFFNKFKSPLVENESKNLKIILTTLLCYNKTLFNNDDEDDDDDDDDDNNDNINNNDDDDNDKSGKKNILKLLTKSIMIDLNLYSCKLEKEYNFLLLNLLQKNKSIIFETLKTSTAINVVAADAYSYKFFKNLYKFIKKSKKMTEIVTNMLQQQQQQIQDLEHFEYLKITAKRLYFPPPAMPLLEINNKEAMSLCSNYSVPIKQMEYASLYEFEKLAFNNKVIINYTEYVKFSNYFFLNTMFSLNLKKKEDLKFLNSWQSKLCLFIQETNFNDFITISCFYENFVVFNNVEHNVSFVPKFKVRLLKKIPSYDDDDNEEQQYQQTIKLISSNYFLRKKNLNQQPSTFFCNEKFCSNFNFDKLLQIRNNINFNNTKFINSKYMLIFLLIPFYKNNLILENGKIIYLNLQKKLTHKSSLKLIQLSIETDYKTINKKNQLLTDIVNFSKLVSFKDALKIAVHSTNVSEQCYALILLRQMIGDVLKIKNYNIRLPYFNELYYYIVNYRNYKNKNILIFPQSIISANNDILLEYVTLIQNLSKSCMSKINATVLCSKFFLPECMYKEIFNLLNNNEEYYIFLTLILQEHNNLTFYKNFRDSLNVNFFQIYKKNTLKLKKNSAKNTYNFSYSDDYYDNVKNALTKFNEKNLQPIDLAYTPINDINNLNLQFIKENFEYIEFYNKQFNDLIKFNSTVLNDNQLLIFISLILLTEI